MLKCVVVFANSAAEGSQLIYEANSIAERSVLISTAEGLKGTDTVYTVPQDKSIVTALKAIVEKIKEENPELVLCQAGRDGRLLAGYLASALNISPMPEAGEIKIEQEGVETTRLVYGGLAVKTEYSAYPAVVVATNGSVSAEENLRESEFCSLEEQPQAELELISTAELAAGDGNIASAKKIVCVGRGISKQENLAVVEKLAKAVGAEMGCTRPVAEEEHWYEKSRYIGVSGCMLKPQFYLGFGISGQIQHMVGVNKAGVIFAVNKDENAPIFKQADYGLVGDCVSAAEAILERLNK